MIYVSIILQLISVDIIVDRLELSCLLFNRLSKIMDSAKALKYIELLYSDVLPL